MRSNVRGVRQQLGYGLKVTVFVPFGVVMILVFLYGYINALNVLFLPFNVIFNVIAGLVGAALAFVLLLGLACLFHLETW